MSLFAVALVVVAVSAQIMILAHAQSSVRAELATSGSVYDRIWALRANALAGSAGVLARDFGFRTAVASGDRATIDSAVVNLRERADVANAFVVDHAGDVIGEGPAFLRETVARLPETLPEGRTSAVVVAGNQAYRIIVSPILAPTEIGWVVFAVPLDQTEMTALERLSAIPLTATMLRRDAQGHWRSTDGRVSGVPALDLLVAGSIANSAKTPATIDLPQGMLSRWSSRSMGGVRPRKPR